MVGGGWPEHQHDESRAAPQLAFARTFPNSAEERETPAYSRSGAVMVVLFVQPASPYVIQHADEVVKGLRLYAIIVYA
jgi:hypothetical protein